MRKAWRMRLEEVQHQVAEWGTVKGPMGTLINHLYTISWLPLGPDKWQDHEGETWQLDPDDSSRDWSPLVQALKEACIRLLGHKAAQHRNGSGLQHGYDLSMTKRHLRKLADQGNYKARGALLAATVGGCWPPARLHQAGLIPTAQCACGHPLADDFHGIWDCPLLETKIQNKYR